MLDVGAAAERLGPREAVGLMGMNEAGIAFAAAVAFAAMCYSIAIYNIEAEKNETMMFQECVKSGGDWLSYWNNKSYCKHK